MSIATEGNSGNIYMINRDNYESAQDISENSIYLVRENSKENCKFISMYLGHAIQSDVLDITDDQDVTYNEVTKEYNIPVQYQVENKLYLHKDGDSFRVFAWSDAEQKYIDCLGSSSNVVVVSVDDVSEITNPVYNYVYVNIKDDHKNIYVYNGSSFIPIIDTSSSVDKAYVDNLTGIDNVTILRDANKLHGAGADVYGKNSVITYDNKVNQTVSGASGAHVYNNYETGALTATYNNAAVGSYSNAFGMGSRSLGNYSFAAGFDVAVDDNAPCATVFGRGTRSYTDATFVCGSYNSCASTAPSSPSDTVYAFVVGNGRTNVEKSDAMTLDKTGNIVLYGDRTVSQGNIKASTGVSLATIRDSISGTPNTHYVDAYLPENGYEVQLSNNTNSYAEITDITISDISKVVNSTTTRTSDYSCTYIFRKAASVTSVESLMSNFTSANTTEVTDVGDNPPKINLLNPDLDISLLNVIHIFLFFDGISMCAIVGGYSYTFPAQT